VLEQISMRPIGFVRGGRREATKDYWGDNRCRLELDEKQFSSEALIGLDEVSHVEVIFYFHIGADEPAEFSVRRPRGRPDWPLVGIFAQHGRYSNWMALRLWWKVSTPSMARRYSTLNLYGRAICRAVRCASPNGPRR
jgi:hypothetical protein